MSGQELIDKAARVLYDGDYDLLSESLKDIARRRVRALDEAGLLADAAKIGNVEALRAAVLAVLDEVERVQPGEEDGAYLYRQLDAIRAIVEGATR